MINRVGIPGGLVAGVLAGAGVAPAPGQLFARDGAGYSAGRIWVEALGIDPATEVLGLWVSAVTVVATVAVLVARSRQAPTVEREPVPITTRSASVPGGREEKAR
jgi:prolipoprotein diacylglyceryltransferase